MIANFKRLEFWVRSRALVKSVYLISKSFPNDEKFGLTNQIRRAVVSIPSNIAEGSGRRTNKDFSHFLDIAIGSICEVETQIYLAYDLEYLEKSKAETLVNELIEIRKMIIGYQKRLK